MKNKLYWLAILASGTLFGFGLSVSTMIQPEVVLSFLRLEDFGLLLVLGGATGLSLLVYQLAPRLRQKPFFADLFKFKTSDSLKKTVVGAVFFGIGWGICGVCPGPAIAGLGAGNWPLIFVVISMLAGSYVQGRWFSVETKTKES